MLRQQRRGPVPELGVVLTPPALPAGELAALPALGALWPGGDTRSQPQCGPAGAAPRRWGAGQAGEGQRIASVAQGTVDSLWLLDSGSNQRTSQIMETHGLRSPDQESTSYGPWAGFGHACLWISHT